MLYNKYRPQTFDDVCGQEAAEVLKHQVSTNRVGHAYLFTGVRGTGKTTCAKILARAANCSHPVNGNPCGICDSCRTSIDATNPDIIEIDGASNNGVDNIRDLIKNVSYSPLNKAKVYIIDEVHMLSSSAFNAMLKTLEEPPANALFILATTELSKVPATVKSRCQILNFTNIDEEVIAERIKYVCEKENFKYSDEGIKLLSKEANGSLRDGLSVLESLNGDISKDNIENSLGLISFEKISNLYNGLIQVNKMTSINLALNLLKNGVLGQEVIERLSQFAVDNLMNIDYLSVNELILSESILAINNIRAGLSDRSVLMHFIIKVCQDDRVTYVKKEVPAEKSVDINKEDKAEHVPEDKVTENFKEEPQEKVIESTEKVSEDVIPDMQQTVHETKANIEETPSNIVDDDLTFKVKGMLYDLSPVIKQSTEDIVVRNDVIYIYTDILGRIFLNKNLEAIKNHLSNSGIRNSVSVLVK